MGDILKTIDCEEVKAVNSKLIERFSIVIHDEIRIYNELQIIVDSMFNLNKICDYLDLAGLNTESAYKEQIRDTISSIRNGLDDYEILEWLYEAMRDTSFFDEVKDIHLFIKLKFMVRDKKLVECGKNVYKIA